MNLPSKRSEPNTNSEMSKALILSKFTKFCVKFLVFIKNDKHG